MPALFESEWDGQPGSNYDWSAVSLYEANGTEDGQSCGVAVDAFGDSRVIPNADVPRLIAALQEYATRLGLAAVSADTPADTMAEAVMDVLAPPARLDPDVAAMIGNAAPVRIPVFTIPWEGGQSVIPSIGQVRALAEQIVTAIRTTARP